MGIANLTISNIKPELSILGDKQTFIYRPTEPSACAFVLKNLTAVSDLSSANTNFDFLNVNFKGFRLGHNTDVNNSAGLFHFSHLIYNSGTATFDATPLLTFNDNNSDAFNFVKPVVFTQGLQTNITPVAGLDIANKTYVDTAVAGSALLVGNDINVNTSGGSNNWLRRSNVTKTGVTVYGLSAASSSFLLESNSGESVGIGFSGSSDGCTIWNPGDAGSYLNIQDEDASNARKAYVDTSGAWIQVSSKKQKHSIRQKSNNKILARFLQLSVKSYGYKCTTSKNADETAIKRVNKKSNKMQIGLILEELFTLFPNCVPDYYNPLFQDKKPNQVLKVNEEIQDVANSGINYNVLLCYFIMAFQEYIRKTNAEINDLKRRANNNQE